MKNMWASFALLYVLTSLYLAFISPHWVYLLDKPLFAGSLLGICLWFPGIIGLIFAKRERISLKIFGHLNRFFFLGPFCIYLLMIFALLLSLPFVETRNVPHIFWMLFFAYPLAITGNMLFALGEELYWRGYLWKKFFSCSPIRSIFIIGLLWGIWHWPFLFFLRQYHPKASIFGTIYPSSPWLGYLFLPLFTLLLSFLFSYFHMKGKAIMIPAAMHGMVSQGIFFAWAFYATPNSFLLGMTGITGLLITLLFCLFLKLFSSNTWKKLV